MVRTSKNGFDKFYKMIIDKSKYFSHSLIYDNQLIDKKKDNEIIPVFGGLP